MKKFLLALFFLFNFTLHAQLQLVVLGTAQDAGYPHAGCLKQCCQRAWENPEMRRHATSLAVINPETGERWLFDATPDIKEQLYFLDQICPRQGQPILSGIFLTHAHIGHYLGLYAFGREVLGTHEIPVYAMEKMCLFLNENGPWDQLVKLNNISIRQLENNRPVHLLDDLQIVPILVPHRGEYTETVGYKIIGPNQTILFIPDIDSWDEWDLNINTLIEEVDYAFLDATFFSADELPGRDLSEIPHPLVTESLQRFSSLNPENRAKIHFIHINHSNPLLWDPHTSQYIKDIGFNISNQHSIINL